MGWHQKEEMGGRATQAVNKHGAALGPISGHSGSSQSDPRSLRSLRSLFSSNYVAKYRESTPHLKCHPDVYVSWDVMEEKQTPPEPSLNLTASQRKEAPGRPNAWGHRRTLKEWSGHKERLQLNISARRATSTGFMGALVSEAVKQRSCESRLYRHCVPKKREKEMQPEHTLHVDCSTGYRR
ncbi:unnamed protein product [Pleuronectes platessa]|uniref:Uncharacterized protein n=1 Tax=Pleuronectes platessa TaxID=8262 RepID=A0A9N7VC51_PLEPL|nr:unnamed protein product [Pleuronectes platessa]